jgi:hypothetical protein
MSRISPARRRGRLRGQALVEFALVLFPAVLLMWGIVHGYFVFRAYTALGEAAEVGAETAAVFGQDCPKVEEAIASSLRGDFVTLPFFYTVEFPDRQAGEPPCAHVGDRVVVRVGYTEPLRFIFWDITPAPQSALRFAERDCGW